MSEKNKSHDEILEKICKENSINMNEKNQHELLKELAQCFSEELLTSFIPALNGKERFFYLAKQKHLVGLGLTAGDIIEHVEAFNFEHQEYVQSNKQFFTYFLAIIILQVYGKEDFPIGRFFVGRIANELESQEQVKLIISLLRRQGEPKKQVEKPEGYLYKRELEQDILNLLRFTYNDILSLLEYLPERQISTDSSVMNLVDLMNLVKNGMEKGTDVQKVKYIKTQMIRYKDHKYAKEVLEFLYRSYCDLLDNANSEFERKAIMRGWSPKAPTKDKISFSMVTSAAQNAFNEGAYDKVFECLQPLVDGFIKNNLYENDFSTVYVCCNNELEEKLYLHHFANEIQDKTIVWLDIDYAQIFWLYGLTACALEKFDLALKALEKSKVLCPVSERLHLGFMSYYTAAGEMDNLLDAIKNCMKYTYHRDVLSTCYICLAQYFMAKEKYCEAGVFLYMSRFYSVDKEYLQNEISYLCKKTGEPFKEPTSKEIQRVFEKYEITFGADPFILKTIKNIIAESQSEQNYADLSYYKDLLENLEAEFFVVSR